MTSLRRFALPSIPAAAFSLAAITLAESDKLCAQTLSDHDLRNASYLFPITTDWWVQLTDGEYSETDEHGSTLRLWLEHVARGDLDGDGDEEAAVVLVWNGGGSGTFLSLAVVENWNGLPMHAGTIRLPDRSDVRALEVDGRRIVAHLLEPPRPRPRAMTDPEQVRVYEWQDGELIGVTRELACSECP